MDEKDMLLRKIQMYDFCLNEINLYLDTHTTCPFGLEFYRKYRDLRKAAFDEYNMKFGPLTILNVTNTDKWTWATEDWPWVKGE